MVCCSEYVLAMNEDSIHPHFRSASGGTEMAVGFDDGAVVVKVGLFHPSREPTPIIHSWAVIPRRFLWILRAS